MNSKMAFKIIVVIFIALFLLFTDSYHRYVTQQASQKLSEYSNVIANPIWNFEIESPTEYLTLAAELNGYDKVEYNSFTGELLFRINGPEMNSLDELLYRLKLIKLYRLETEIIYKNATLGKLTAEWRLKSIYIYMNVFLCLGLILQGVWLYFRLMESNKILEKRVTERTIELEQANIDLKKGEENLSITLNSIGDAVIATDSKGAVKRMNPVAEKLTGWSMKEAEGKALTEVYSIVDTLTGEKAHNPIDRVLKNGETLELGDHITLVGNDGIRRNISDSFAPIKSVQGDIVGVVLVFQDVTENYRIEEERIRLIGILESTIDLVSTIYPDFSIAYMNRSGRKLVGWGIESDLTHKTLDSIYPDWAFKIIRNEGIPYAEEHGNWEGEVALLAEGGIEIPVSQVIMVHSSRLGAVDYYSTIIRDIKEAKLAEAELKNHRDHLEILVRERTAELEHSINELKQTQRQLIESEKMSSLGGLVAGIAHEINTPIGISLLDASFLDEKTESVFESFNKGTLKKSDFESYIKNAKQSSKSILCSLKRSAELIQSFKQVAVDQSSEAFRRFRVKEYIEEVLLSLHNQLKKTSHAVHILCPDDLEIVSYPGAFSQIITNFVMNSVIHGFENIEKGEMTIEVASIDGELSFKYSDTGKGMNEDVMKQIFDPFFTTKRGRGGSGLGMHIVYNLVTQRLSGTIECESTEGQGVLFKIIIPLDAGDSLPFI